MAAGTSRNASLRSISTTRRIPQQEYETLLSTARSGFVIEEEEAAELGGVLRKGLFNGHSVYHIIQSVGEESIGYSSKTIYTL